MRWPWRREARLVEPRRAVSHKATELETAKEILAEVFHAQPCEMVEMISRRLEDGSWKKEREKGLWPAIFCLGKCPQSRHKEIQPQNQFTLGEF